MSARVLLPIIFLVFLIPSQVLARTTPEDIRRERAAEFQNSLAKIPDPAKKQLVLQGNELFNEINQKVCSRFDVDVARMAAVLEELKSRQGVTKTIVAYGQGNTPLDTAAYYLNYAAEAVAYQKAQDYTPAINSGNLKPAFNASLNNLNSNLQILQNKILKAKAEVQKAIIYYEK